MKKLKYIACFLLLSLLCHCSNISETFSNKTFYNITIQFKDEPLIFKFINDSLYVFDGYLQKQNFIWSDQGNGKLKIVNLKTDSVYIVKYDKIKDDIIELNWPLSNTNKKYNLKLSDSSLSVTTSLPDTNMSFIKGIWEITNYYPSEINDTIVFFDFISMNNYLYIFNINIEDSKSIQLANIYNWNLLKYEDVCIIIMEGIIDNFFFLKHINDTQIIASVFVNEQFQEVSLTKDTEVINVDSIKDKLYGQWELNDEISNNSGLRPVRIYLSYKQEYSFIYPNRLSMGYGSWLMNNSGEFIIFYETNSFKKSIYRISFDEKILSLSPMSDFDVYYNKLNSSTKASNFHR